MPQGSLERGCSFEHVGLELGPDGCRRGLLEDALQSVAVAGDDHVQLTNGRLDIVEHGENGLVVRDVENPRMRPARRKRLERGAAVLRVHCSRR
ncbi:hypothetical protein RKD29_007743 [Streptomyces tendae]